MCGGCSINKLTALPRTEQILIPSLIQFLVMAGHERKDDWRTNTPGLAQTLWTESYINFIKTLSGIVKGTAVYEALLTVSEVENKSPIDIIRHIQTSMFRLTGITSAPVENFLYNIGDIRLWAYPCWTIILWSSLRTDSKTLTSLISYLSDIIPCKECAGHIKEYLITNQMKENDDLFAWSEEFYGTARKVKKNISKSDYDHWKNFYSEMTDK